jgi:ubiquinone/menaquinone biosynthesis C-methylase UbiE
MKQTDIMLAGEADAWFARNRSQLGAHDPVGRVIADLGLKPQAVLEIGCANGWRLKALQAHCDCDIYGIDPSRDAVADADVRTIGLGTADSLPFGNASLDMVIFGFCLYLCDPADLFRIAAEADRVLDDGGHLIIHDFADIEPPFARPYEHRDGVLAYHLDHAKLWLAHPWYTRVCRRPFSDGLVTVLAKRCQFAMGA